MSQKFITQFTSPKLMSPEKIRTSIVETIEFDFGGPNFRKEHLYVAFSCAKHLLTVVCE